MSATDRDPATRLTCTRLPSLPCKLASGIPRLPSLTLSGLHCTDSRVRFFFIYRLIGVITGYTRLARRYVFPVPLPFRFLAGRGQLVVPIFMTVNMLHETEFYQVTSAVFWIAKASLKGIHLEDEIVQVNNSIFFREQLTVPTNWKPTGRPVRQTNSDSSLGEIDSAILENQPCYQTLRVLD